MCKGAVQPACKAEQHSQHSDPPGAPSCRRVFGGDMAIQLCIWHVKQAWLKNLYNKVNDAVARNAIMQGLSAIMATPLEGDVSDMEAAVQQALASLRKQYSRWSAFWEYINKEWAGKKGALNVRTAGHACSWSWSWCWCCPDGWLARSAAAQGGCCRAGLRQNFVQPTSPRD